ncbi:hypothetical protein M0813_02368 [Anaeramoeba flamelloides]|uniref:t-SNARE coiled-coil homology domain-containing protein n=1 Tax=Anaeramoeba flamelloides TaxID=1746091 RepID=A0ABQ8YIH8_9EUKA|nr:hypothetical protein M0813_02368 [Anaeramoeba flamelloides]
MTFKTTDPFFLLKGEIKKLLPSLGAHYDHWEELILTTNTANNDEFSWTQEELLKGIKDVNWYCHELELTINKVAENPDHYKIDQEELLKRKKLIEREQDDELDAIHGTITRVKEMGNVIGEEIDEHNKMLEDLSDDMDTAKGKLKRAMRKSKKLLNSKDRGKMCTIFILIIVLVVLLIVVFQ